MEERNNKPAKKKKRNNGKHKVQQKTKPDGTIKILKKKKT